MATSKDIKLKKIPGTDPEILQKRKKNKQEIDRAELLKNVESELRGLLTPQGRQWARSCILLMKVRNEKLYEGTYASFTQWVNSLSDRLHCKASNLWTRLQAGKAYYAFIDGYAKPHGIKVPPLIETTAAAGSIVAASKIRQKDPKRGDEAMMKAINGRLTKHQLELEWQHVRGDKKRAHAAKVQHAKQAPHRKSAPQNTSSRTSYSIDDDKLRELMDQIKPEDKSQITEKQMAGLFWNHYLWCAPEGSHVRTRDVYMTAQEVPTDNSNTSHARRMDVCVLSNLDQGFSKTGRLTVHCIECKTDKSTLVRDKKMQEYVPFCDFFWLSVTPELKDLALAYADKNWGILTVGDDHKIRVVRQAIRHECSKRQTTFSQFLSKICFGEWKPNKTTKEMQKEG